jgi:hypothetical protein
MSNIDLTTHKENISRIIVSSTATAATVVPTQTLLGISIVKEAA